MPLLSLGISALDAAAGGCSGRAMGNMGRGTPRLIALLAIGIVVAAIYYVQQRNAPQQQSAPPNVVYVSPNVTTPAPAPAP